MKNFVRVISYLMHPLLIPLYVVFLVFNVDSVFYFTPWGAKLYCYMVTAFALLLMPIISLPFFKYMKLITSYELDLKQERVYPILVAVGFAFAGFWLIGRLPYTNIIQQLYLVLIILLSGFSIITLRWKMSMHMTGMGALCGFLIIIGWKYLGDVRQIFMLMVLLSGLLASCRLYLEKHTPLQIYAGFLFGCCFVVGILC